MSDHTTFLRDLADTLDSCEWHHPLGSAELCRRVAGEMEQLRDALETLMDEQNGPPLYKHAKSWHAAMAEACRLTGRTEGEKLHNEAKENP